MNAPLAEAIALTDGHLSKSTRDMVVALDRPRNASITEKVRTAGAGRSLLGTSAALGPAISNSGVDLYAGIGGAPEEF